MLKWISITNRSNSNSLQTSLSASIHSKLFGNKWWMSTEVGPAPSCEMGNLFETFAAACSRQKVFHSFICAKAFEYISKFIWIPFEISSIKVNTQIMGHFDRVKSRPTVEEMNLSHPCWMSIGARLAHSPTTQFPFSFDLMRRRIVSIACRDAGGLPSGTPTSCPCTNMHPFGSFNKCDAGIRKQIPA